MPRRTRWTFFTLGLAGLHFGTSRVWLCASPPALGSHGGEAGFTGHTSETRPLSRRTSRIQMAQWGQKKKHKEYGIKKRRIDGLPEFTNGNRKPVAPYVASVVWSPREWKRKEKTPEQLAYATKKDKKYLTPTQTKAYLAMGRLDPPQRKWYLGRVKSYSPIDGFGFIYCKETMQQYGSDVFLHRDQVLLSGGANRIMKGTVLSFTVDLNKFGRPQARDIKRRLTGRVKSFNAQAGYGFIACDLAAEAGLGDIFLPLEQMEAAQVNVGDFVDFDCQATAKGQLQARSVQLSEEGFSLSGEDIEHDVGNMLLQE